MDVSQTPGSRERTLDESGDAMNRDPKAESLNRHLTGVLLTGNLGDDPQYSSQMNEGPMDAPLLRQLVEISGLPEEYIEEELVPSLPQGQRAGAPVTLDDLRAAMLELLDRMNEDMGGDPSAEE